MRSKKRKKRRRIKIVPVLITLIIIVGLACGGVFGYKYMKNKKSDKPQPDKPKEEEKIEPVEYTASMVMVGDALIHSSVYNDANRLADWNGYDFKPQITLIKEKTINYDIAYYNQETILGGTSLGLSDYPTFNSPQEIGDAMIDAGFNLVSLATNHTVDRGKQAVLNSREYWNSKEGIQAVGSYSSEEEKKEIETRVLEVNNIKYAMLNYTYGTNGMPVSDSYLVNVWPTDIDNINNPEYDDKYQAYKDTVAKDIEAIRDKVDVLMVAMHWGVEYTHTPTAYEKDMANFLADHGVDIVIGAHPHVIQPVEYIGNTLVIYSLGNFISAQYQNQGTCTYYKCMVGLMSSLKITKTVTGDKVDIKVDNVENDLIYTYYTGWRYFKIIPFSNPAIKEYLGDYYNVYNTYADVIKSDDERIKTVPLAE